MSSSGRSSGGSAFTQGLLAARPAAAVGIPPYFATDTGEWWIPNAAGNAWQSIAGTSASVFGVALALSGGTAFTQVGDSVQNDNVFFFRGPNQGVAYKGATLGLQTPLRLSIGGLNVAEGANARQGVATLVAGTVTVANTSVTANTRILVFPQEAGALTGDLRVSARVAGTSFTVTSTVGTDTATFAWLLLEPG